MRDWVKVRRSNPASRSPGSLVAAVILAAGVVAGCVTATPTTSGPNAASHQAAPQDFALLGSWSTTISKDDVRAAGFTDPGAANENSGMFTWVFEQDGSWRQIQASLDASPIVNPVFSGRYTVAGSVVTVVTEFPPDYRDDGLRYAFELVEGAVRFDLLNPPDPMLPVIVETYPWTRTQP